MIIALNISAYALEEYLLNRQIISIPPQKIWTRGLDDYSIEVFIKKMKDLIEKGKTVIIASHDFVDIGYSRFITMKNGKLYEETAK